MPVAFVPTQSGAHRLACRSLYRALLASCASFSPGTGVSTRPGNLSRTERTASQFSVLLKSLVRYRYHHDRRLQNPRQIRDALEFGRQSLKNLHDASRGSQEALQKMAGMLTDARELATTILRTKQHCDKDSGSPPPHVQKKQEYIRMVSNPATYVSPKPGSIPILIRPVALSQIKSKKRRWPQLVVTQGMPFLRYHRKQPPLLGLYLRSVMRREERRWEVLQEMDAMCQMGLYEDQWDEEIAGAHGIGDADPGPRFVAGQRGRKEQPESWTSAFQQTKNDIRAKLKAQDKKHMEWGQKLFNIMVRERQMARRERKEEKQKRKTLRKGTAVTASS